MMYSVPIIAFTSYGNDSIALLKWLSLLGCQNVRTVYSNTGWAAPDWAPRVEQAEDWVRSLGWVPHRTESEGFAALCLRKQTFPRGMMQFCTGELKVEPARRWLEANDPCKQAICCVGVRRSESKHRSTYPEYRPDSVNHGGRTLWAPLVRFSDRMRDELVEAAGFPVLPHRSMECSPCIHGSRADLRLVSPSRVAEIAELEAKVSARCGKPRTMYRPVAFQGATGIHEVMRWAHSERGQYRPGEKLDEGTGPSESELGCEGGFCGM